MGKKIRVWDGTAWQDVSPSLPYTAIHSAQASMPLTGVDGQVWLDTDGTLAGQDFVPLSGATMTGNLNTPSINSGGIAGRNKFLNADFSIWQRGTSFTNPTVNQYLADRWFFGGGSNFTGTISAQTFNPGAAPIAGYESTYFWRFNGSATTPVLGQRIEDVRTFAGQTVTLSFWAKANVAMSTGVFNIYQYFGSGGSNGVDNPSPNGINLTTSWARYSVTINVASISGKTIGSNSYFFPYINLPSMSSNIIDFWGWQIESGSIATSFTTNTANPQTELAACQRYYFRTSSPSSFGVQATGMATSTTAGQVEITLPVTLRTSPTLFEYGSVIIADGVGSSTITSLVINSYNQSVLSLSFSGAAGLTQYRPYKLINNATVNGYIAVGSEL